MIEIAVENCIKCKKCERICPVNGIDVANQNISDDCISCHHCGAICPNGAINDKNTIGEASQNNIQPSDFELLMQQRRTHRIFSTKAVEPELLKEFIEHMRYSPTASNMQDLQFTIVTNPDTIKEINDLTKTTLTKAFNGLNSFSKILLRAFKGSKTVETMEKSKRKFLNKAELHADMICYNAPALIVIHSEETPVSMPCHDANIWTGMAILYAELLNLCTCINGYIVNAAKRNKAINKALFIPDDNTIHSVLLIGYPKMKFENWVERKMPKINLISK